MTFRGSLTAVSRHGINRGEQGPLLRASFEETVGVVNQASLFGEYDDVVGVTENVMLGPSLKLSIKTTANKNWDAE
jgi:DNA-directed RNA polymerase II subunit RPB1